MSIDAGVAIGMQDMQRHPWGTQGQETVEKGRMYGGTLVLTWCAMGFLMHATLGPGACHC